jgi:hypothetical protein
VSNVLKSGSLNLLEPSGLVQACNGIALPFAFTNTVTEARNSEVGATTILGHEIMHAKRYLKNIIKQEVSLPPYLF